MKWINLFFFSIVCLILIFGFKYIGDNMQKAETYICYYDIPSDYGKSPWDARVIEPYCILENQTTYTLCKYCTHAGTKYTKGLS